MVNQQPSKVKRSNPQTLFVACGCVLVAISLLIVFTRPDKPQPFIASGSSTGENFSVQVIRPRTGLPIAGLLPPKLFGLDESLSFDAQTSNATCRIGPNDRLEFSADKWSLVLQLNQGGRISPQSFIEFEMIFEDELTKVRCRPKTQGDSFFESEVNHQQELSGRFQLQLERCVERGTGNELEWPPSPLILRGSFDRIPLSN